MEILDKFKYVKSTLLGTYKKSPTKAVLKMIFLFEGEIYWKVT